MKLSVGFFLLNHSVARRKKQRYKKDLICYECEGDQIFFKKQLHLLPDSYTRRNFTEEKDPGHNTIYLFYSPYCFSVFFFYVLCFYCYGFLFKFAFIQIHRHIYTHACPLSILLLFSYANCTRRMIECQSKFSSQLFTKSSTRAQGY